MGFRPSYIGLYESGELSGRIGALNLLHRDCTLCPRRCRVDRRVKNGVCRTGVNPVVSAAMPHFGEEPPLVGWGGSGTIFLSNCNLRCIFCQNHDISYGGDGREVTSEELSSMMTRLQRQGCHNINFVTPTHQVPQIVEALPKAIENGLDVPLVYNCGGYESVEALRLLEGVFDIYMPDMKYSDDDIAVSLSFTPDYFRAARAAVKEMHRQVGDLVADKNGVATRGLIVRHLVLPNGMAGTEKVMRFLAEEISRNTYVNVMDQYRPCFKASGDPRITRRITKEEFECAVKAARDAGLLRIEGTVQF